MKKFFSLLLSAGMLFGFTACGDDDGGNQGDGPDKPGAFSAKITTVVTGNSVDVTVEPGKGFDATAYKVWVVKKAEYAATVPATAVDGTGKLTKTFEDLSYDETYYAVVSDGTEFKTKEFITPEPPKDLPKALQGSNYFVLNMDATSFPKIENKVTSDLRPDDLTCFIDWWNGAAFTVGTCTGPNSLGEVEGWMSLNIVPGSGWFGACYRLIDPATGTTPEAITEATKRRAHLSEIDGTYVLHLAMKSTAAGDYSVRVFGSGDEGGISVIIGNENAAYGFKRDGAWHEIEIPMSVFMASPKFDLTTVNMLAFVQASEALPQDINLDAAFIYKPAK